MNILTFIITNKIKYSKVMQTEKGFTVIELLVGFSMAFIIIISLLGFMINVIEIDRKEQAKATSEQEIQAALDYIYRDLKQAVYIYDANGIDAIKNQLPDPPRGIDRVPILVFWQRELITDVLSLGTGKDDAFVYSLVVYYLMRDTTVSGSNWSKIARIGKWQIRDGVLAHNNDATTFICPRYPGKYIKGSSSSPNEYCPSNGFAPFNLHQQGTLEQIMNSWKRDDTVAYTVNTLVLVDYIDNTINNAPPKICPPNSINPTITWSQVPPASFNDTDTGKMTSFYACVDRLHTTAQIFIRGNALARLKNHANINYSTNQKTYFPTASMKVQGRGNLFK
ncbi:MAG: hypothetical protein EAZ77_01280 [Nostocales cyanobacterium]|nr:MAG: hypothetical protein EAZ77_01280 [Nostocales cyanobacterium]